MYEGCCKINFTRVNMEYPDILTTISGVKINYPTEWEAFRRREILSLFEEFVYGCRPLQCYFV